MCTIMEMRKEVSDSFPGGFLRCDCGYNDFGMSRENPEKFCSGIAAAAANGNP